MDKQGYNIPLENHLRGRNREEKGKNHIYVAKYLGTMQFNLSNQLCLVGFPNGSAWPLPRLMN